MSSVTFATTTRFSPAKISTSPKTAMPFAVKFSTDGEFVSSSFEHDEKSNKLAAKVQETMVFSVFIFFDLMVESKVAK
ncbi:MAG: hypothetical protein ACI97X_002268 [Oceanospirillaceae bacterium]|jgi:hypothetical protein